MAKAIPARGPAADELPMLSQQRRDTIGVMICIVSGAIYAAWVFHTKERLTLNTFLLWVVWSEVADWVGQRGRFLFMQLKQIHAEAKRGKLKLQGVALWIERASHALFITAAMTFFAK